MTTATGIILDALAEAVTTPAPAGTAVIQHAQDVLSRLESGDFPFPWLAQRSDSVGICKAWLLESLEDHAGVSAVPPRIRPESLFPDLEHQDDAVKTALERLAEDIAANAGALVLAVREACGDKAAAYVNGTEGES